jgi:hypothetical protein
MSMRKHGVVYRPPDGTSRYLFACACHWDTWSAIRRASHTAYWSDRDQALFNFLGKMGSTRRCEGRVQRRRRCGTAGGRRSRIGGGGGS